MAFLSGEVEHQEAERSSERISRLEIRFFGVEHEAKLWLLSVAAGGPFPHMLG
jgi:hypothetical protein